MGSHEELLTVIRDLKTARRAKCKEEKKEEGRLEELKLRLRMKMNRPTEPKNDTPATRTD